MKSVLQDWVMELPLRAQGTLLTGIRGCDLAPKNPLNIEERYGCSTGENTPERSLSAFLRFSILNAADQREVDVCGAWFKSTPPFQWKPSQLMHYPLHWYSHIMHCFEVVAYCHPNDSIKEYAFDIYRRMVHSLHLNIESEYQMMERLTEDRVANGTVVS